MGTEKPFHRTEFRNAAKALWKDYDFTLFHTLTIDQKRTIVESKWKEEYNISFIRHIEEFRNNSIKYAVFESEEDYLVFILKWS